MRTKRVRRIPVSFRDGSYWVIVQRRGFSPHSDRAEIERIKSTYNDLRRLVPTNWFPDRETAEAAFSGLPEQIRDACYVSECLDLTV